MFIPRRIAASMGFHEDTPTQTSTTELSLITIYLLLRRAVVHNNEICAILVVFLHRNMEV